MDDRYFIGTAADKPAVRHMYNVSTSSDDDTVLPALCLTCGTFNTDNKECTYNSIEFSAGMKYYVHGCDGPNAPRSVIKETSVKQKKKKNTFQVSFFLSCIFL